jgi:hypothetical protein
VQKRLDILCCSSPATSFVAIAEVIVVSVWLFEALPSNRVFPHSSHLFQTVCGFSQSTLSSGSVSYVNLETLVSHSIWLVISVRQFSARTSKLPTVPWPGYQFKENDSLSFRALYDRSRHSLCERGSDRCPSKGPWSREFHLANLGTRVTEFFFFFSKFEGVEFCQRRKITRYDGFLQSDFKFTYLARGTLHYILSFCIRRWPGSFLVSLGDGCRLRLIGCWNKGLGHVSHRLSIAGDYHHYDKFAWFETPGRLGLRMIKQEKNPKSASFWKHQL